MEFRPLGRAGLQVSSLGLGTEYLFNTPRENIIRVIRKAITQGINYFDLFYANATFRDDMGEAFAPYRNQVYLAAHLGVIDCDGQYDKTRDIATCKQWFEDFLIRFHTDYVDVLFLHNIDEQSDYDTVMAPGGVNDLAQEYLRQGRARAIGFSGHTVSTSLQAVESGQVSVLMFPVNLANNTVLNQSGSTLAGQRNLLRTCAQQGVAVVAMKPYAGGHLLAPTHQDSLAISPVRCLAYILAQSAVATVVPGCKNLEQLVAALAVTTASEAEKDYAQAITKVKQWTPGDCVYCNHCLPCPSNIDIARVMRLYDQSQLELTPNLQSQYAQLVCSADDCIQCGACEERCPFGVPVIERMERAAATL
ncbi:MAG: aldo/keto reductase [Anaerolineae bacterium]